MKFILIFLSIGLFAQSKTDVSEMLVFDPDEQSGLFNEIYTSNFFFGNFDLRYLANAVDINYQNVKTISITAESSGRVIEDAFVLEYDEAGKLMKMKISKAFFGNDLTVDYKYRDGLITEEIFKDSEGSRANKFHYSNGKMVVENTKGMIDVFSLSGKILMKDSYLDGNLVFEDKVVGRCRVTSYNQMEIDKICFSNFLGKLPMDMQKFIGSEDGKNAMKLEPGEKWSVKKVTETEYEFYNGSSKLYVLELNQDKTIKNFKFLGIKSEFKKPVNFSFKYNFY